MSPRASFRGGGCITRQWTCTLAVSESIIDLLSAEPALMAKFERLHERHARSIPRVLPWGQTHLSKIELDRSRVGCLMTSCSKARGLSTVCWYAGGSGSGRGRGGGRR